ncbi:MAG: prenyltransferase, partial [Planctomycetes bacterium]|nr:prenyltransferase [Planctomycetota bacterium]
MRIVIIMCCCCCLQLAAVERSLEKAVGEGLLQLVKLQAEDGSYSGGTGMTSLAGMAFLAGGHTPTRGEYKDASAKCLASILSKQDSMSGYLASGGHGRMYAHGFATLYLAECYGMTPNKRVRNALEAALELIYRSQNNEGGWRYDPTPTSADLSVTVCQINAIRASHNVGIGGERSQMVIGKALEYVRACHRGNGSFSYMRGSGGSWGAR